MLIVSAVNKSNLADVSDYDVVVQINDLVIGKYTVKGHERAKGYPDLLRMIADHVEQTRESNKTRYGLLA